MSSDLVRRATGEARPRWNEREVVKRAREAYDEVQLADFEATGAFAFAAKAMQGAVELDQVRQQLSAGDPVTNAMLADFEATALQKVKNIQRNLYSDFGL